MSMKDCSRMNVQVVIREQVEEVPDLSSEIFESTTEAVFTPPTYTMKEIYEAIPPHCLQPDTSISLFYILRDIFYVTALVSITTFIPLIPHPHIRPLAWVAYTFLQGLVFTGLWELAHEAGHGALSKSKTFNNAAGLLIHSFLLVPFHSWRITHSTHHKNTNNLDKDIAFVPSIVSDYEAEHEGRSKVWEYIEDMPLVALTHLFFHQLIAFPLYLTINNLALERMRKARWWRRSHFYFGGHGPNFKAEHYKDVLISDLGIAIAVAGLYALGKQLGAWNVMLFYGFPYLWTNHWIRKFSFKGRENGIRTDNDDSVTITFLQHTDFSIPYYPTNTWTFLRGAASTVDRDFGFIGRHLFHGAIEGHVMHHHVSRIPFYYAAEATQAVRKVMGTHYQSDFKTPYLWAFWKNYRTCRHVVETEKASNIYFFAKTE